MNGIKTFFGAFMLIMGLLSLFTAIYYGVVSFSGNDYMLFNSFLGWVTLIIGSFLAISGWLILNSRKK